MLRVFVICNRNSYKLMMFLVMKFLFIGLKIFCVLFPLLISIAYLTLIERKILGSIQGRKGPNIMGFAGILQPLVDGLKLFTKELILPNQANIYIYIVSPIVTFFLSLII